jgi:hypothetical protein
LFAQAYCYEYTKAFSFGGLMDFLFELPQTHGTVLPVSTTHETHSIDLPVTQLQTTVISYATGDNYPNPPK